MFCFFKSICRSLVPRGIVDDCSHGSAYWWRIIGRPFGRPHNQLWDEDLFVDLLQSKEVLSSDHIHILFTQKMQLFHSQVLSFHSLWIIVLVFCLPKLHYQPQCDDTPNHIVGANSRTSPLATGPPQHATGMGTFHHPLDSPTRAAGGCKANMHIYAYLTYSHVLCIRNCTIVYHMYIVVIFDLYAQLVFHPQCCHIACSSSPNPKPGYQWNLLCWQVRPPKDLSTRESPASQLH